MHYRPVAFAVLILVAGGGLLSAPAAHADNQRLNGSVVANVYTVQHQQGCTNDVRINPQLQLAAQWHTLDVLNNRNLDGDVGSDGSVPKTGPTRRATRATWRKRWRSIQRTRSVASS